MLYILLQLRLSLNSQTLSKHNQSLLEFAISIETRDLSSQQLLIGGNNDVSPQFQLSILYWGGVTVAAENDWNMH